MSLSRVLYEKWKKEETTHIVGWDFSHIDDRFFEDSPPWDYVTRARALVRESSAVLDMGTAGGELFSSLVPLPIRAAATEIDSKFAITARRKLTPLGVEMVECDHDHGMPFSDGEFDLVLNGHSSLPEEEISRVLSSGGVFFTEQVDPQVRGDYRELFGLPISPICNNLNDTMNRFTKAGFEISEGQEFEGKDRYTDVGAVVFTLSNIGSIIEDFSVDKYLPFLEKLQQQMDEGQELTFSMKRYLMLAKKP